MLALLRMSIDRDRRVRGDWGVSLLASGVLVVAAALISLVVPGEPPGVAVTASGGPKLVVGAETDEGEDVSFTLPADGSPFAVSVVDELVVHATPSANAEVIERLSPWSLYGAPRTLLVLDHHLDHAGVDWLEALLPVRPNGTTGWIAADDVEIDTTTVEIQVDLDERELTVVDDGRILLQTPVVIGSSATPTPPGLYYITDPVDLRANPSPAYGTYALGLSGFSEVLDSFAGGLPQLAIHGTQAPHLMGQAVSNGCIRVPNDTAVAIAELVAPRTPVHILAGA